MSWPVKLIQREEAMARCWPAKEDAFVPWSPVKEPEQR